MRLQTDSEPVLVLMVMAVRFEIKIVFIIAIGIHIVHRVAIPIIEGQRVSPQIIVFVAIGIVREMAVFILMVSIQHSLR